MNFLSRYAQYLRDNPEGYWFRCKAYGWGWVPATWQGWLLIAFFLTVFLWIFIPFIQNPVMSEGDDTRFIIKIFAWAAALIGACWLTGEPPKWQWGLPEDKK